MLTITKQQARRFLLKKQLLWPPQALSGPHAVATVFDTLRVVQYDPLNPCGRNTDLVLQSRISDYHPNDYYQWLYNERRGIECYDKELCIVPIEDFPLTVHQQAKYLARSDYASFIKDHASDLEAIMRKIAQEGPICSADIEDDRTHYLGWQSESRWARVALEVLWKIGRIVIAKRENGKKYYDLPVRVFKNDLVEPNDAITKEHILRRLQSVGILPKTGGGTGWQRMKATAVIKKLIASGDLLEVVVEGAAKPYVVRSTDQDLFNESPPPPFKMVFIAPLDTLMWDRDLIHHFFDFFYRWEVYTPQSKRQYGYYVLPILYGDELVGRIEPVLTKDTVLEIRGFWPEKTVTWDKNLTNALDHALQQFQSYLNAKQIIRLRR